MTIILLLSFVLVLSTESMNAAPTESMAAAPTVLHDDQLYDEFLLVLQWPASYCSIGNVVCNFVPPYFTVHGLWLNNNSCPANCLPIPNKATRRFFYKQISNYLYSRSDFFFKRFWPNLNSRRDHVSFLVHEYERHGYCFTRFGTPEVYLQTAQEIHSRTAQNIATSITSSMRPHKEFYEVESFRRVRFGRGILTVGLRCNYAKKSNIPQLLEIVICTYPNKTPKNCSFVDTCNDQWTRNGIPHRGRFQIPENPVFPGFPPYTDPVACNTPYYPHQPSIPVA